MCVHVCVYVCACVCGCVCVRAACVCRVLRPASAQRATHRRAAGARQPLPSALPPTGMSSRPPAPRGPCPFPCGRAAAGYPDHARCQPLPPGACPGVCTLSPTPPLPTSTPPPPKPAHLRYRSSTCSGRGGSGAGASAGAGATAPPITRADLPPRLLLPLLLLLLSPLLLLPLPSLPLLLLPSFPCATLRRSGWRRLRVPPTSPSLPGAAATGGSGRRCEPGAGSWRLGQQQLTRRHCCAWASAQVLAARRPEARGRSWS